VSFAPESLTDAQLADLRGALADFTVDAVHARLGDEAWRALARNETVPARRATADSTPLSTLIRLFQLQLPVSATEANDALPGLCDPLLRAGLLTRHADRISAAADIRPYGDEEHDWWVICDLTPGLDGRRHAMDPHYVLGISEASSSLAQLTVRRPVGRALDLGAGCGVQALHLASQADQVVATDVNRRALRMAKLTARLNRIPIDLREGSLYEPVADERFDLIVTNPPFVVSPPDGERLIYRETEFPADEVVRRVVAGAADRLNDGGWCQVLAAWIHARGVPWRERLASWIEPTGLDAWVVQRERVEPSSYAELWLADAGLRGAADYPERYDRWLRWLDEQDIEAMGFGWINLRKAGRAQPMTRIEEWTGEVVQPMGDEVLGWGDRCDALAQLDATGADPLDRRWRLAPTVRQTTVGRVGAEHPGTITVTTDRGLRRTARVDTVEAGLLGASDGELTPRRILDALATLTDRDAGELRRRYAPVVRQFIEEGFLLSADDDRLSSSPERKAE